MVEHKAELSESSKTKPYAIPPIQIPPQKRTRDEAPATSTDDDTEEPWICRGRD
jgi:hypothetical protein